MYMMCLKHKDVTFLNYTYEELFYHCLELDRLEWVKKTWSSFKNVYKDDDFEIFFELNIGFSRNF